MYNFCFTFDNHVNSQTRINTATTHWSTEETLTTVTSISAVLFSYWFITTNSTSREFLVIGWSITCPYNTKKLRSKGCNLFKLIENLYKNVYNALPESKWSKITRWGFISNFLTSIVCFFFDIYSRSTFPPNDRILQQIFSDYFKKYKILIAERLKNTYCIFVDQNILSGFEK